jgi:hypothetical protein
MRCLPDWGGCNRLAVSGTWSGKSCRRASEHFPWFRQAPVSAILSVLRPQPHHLYWPELDVDLDLESIEHPERFPLVAD